MFDKKKIFISGSSKDRKYAEYLAEYFTQEGYSTWCPTINVGLGKNFYKEIPEAIKNFDAVVLVFSENADKSKTVAVELALAYEYHKPIFVLKIDRSIPEKLQYFVSGVQCCEWLDINDTKSLEKLSQGLKNLFGQENNFAVIKEAISSDGNVDDNQQNVTYVPKPIDTSDVVLPAELLELTELLAANVHDTWAKGRIEEGWTYGLAKNPALKTTPLLVEYEKLPESEKAYDRNTALETIKVLFKLGRLILKE